MAPAHTSDTERLKFYAAREQVLLQLKRRSSWQEQALRNTRARLDFLRTLLDNRAMGICA